MKIKKMGWVNRYVFREGYGEHIMIDSIPYSHKDIAYGMRAKETRLLRYKDTVRIDYRLEEG
jgi:hypothetical protein